MQKSLSDHLVEVLGHTTMTQIAARVRVVFSHRDFLAAVYVDGQLVHTDGIAETYQEVVEAIFDAEWFEQLHSTLQEPSVPEDTVVLDVRMEEAEVMKARLAELEAEASRLRDRLAS